MPVVAIVSCQKGISEGSTRISQRSTCGVSIRTQYKNVQLLLKIIRIFEII